MKQILSLVERRQAEFARLPFFRRLEGPGTLDQARAFIPRLTFFAMAFQDVLRLNESMILDPDLRGIARRHREEDDGHQHWFVHDVRLLGLEQDPAWLFGPDHAPTRDAAYHFIGEIYAAPDDRMRILLLLVLEATGDVFFRRIPGFLRRAGSDAPLRYFAVQHFDVERDHSLFDGEVERALADVELTPERRRSAELLVGRGFGAMAGMVADFERSMARVAPPRDPGGAFAAAAAPAVRG